jgi:hypothetical protein
MAFLNHLREKLESQQIYDGLKGKYEQRFVVNGKEYALIANSVGGGDDDFAQWQVEFENVDLHRINSSDNDPKVIKAFAEAVGEWVKAKNPMYFYTYGSNLENFQKIIEGVKKKVKGYNVVDPTKDQKDESGNVIEGNPIGKIIWTKMVTPEVVLSMDKANTKNTKFEQPYEDVKDVKPNKKFMGVKGQEKWDDGKKAYDTKTESFAEFKAAKLNQ